MYYFGLADLHIGLAVFFIASKIMIGAWVLWLTRMNMIVHPALIALATRKNDYWRSVLYLQ